MNDPSADDPLQEARRRLQAANLRQAELLERVIRLTGEREALEALTRRQAEEIEDARKTLVLAKRHMLAAEAARMVSWELDVATGQVLLGTRWDEMLGEQQPADDSVWSTRDLLERVHPDDVALVRQALGDALSGRSDRYLVEHRVAATRGWIWIESAGMVSERDAGGRALRLTGRNIDITARRKMHEDMAQARAQAEASSRAKSEFLANVSHEVRTPLNAVMGLTRLLQQSPLNPEQRQYLELIDRSATTLLALLNDILDLSRIEAGKLVFEQIRFDIGRWVREAVALHTPAAQAKGLRVEVDIAEDVPRKLEGDPGRLRQIISNLVSNAVKFTEQGRVLVTVRLAPDQAGMQRDQLRLLFAVRDSGVGIPVDKQQQIFESFTQADTSTTRRYGGTGLGLAICARLVSMMSGSIHVLSRPGEGSTFRFTAVFEQSADDLNALSEPAPLEGMGRAGLHVLLAEDHAVNELLMRKLLSQMGYVVTVARDGQEAVRRWEGGRFDLVLMDVQMPVMSGFDATTRIRAIEAARPGCVRTPIVALTAHAMAGDREKCLAAGMDAYVSKPVSPALLAQAIDLALDGPAVAPPDMLQDLDFSAAGRAAPPVPLAVASEAAVAAATGAIDLDQLVQTMGGDRPAVAEIAIAMRSDMAERRDAMRRAAIARNPLPLQEHAHALKGSLATVGAHRAAAAAKQLEVAVRGGDWSAAESRLTLLEQEIAQVELALAHFDTW
jgi:signal transduction histidine kinase/DNA-binding NarL/FixJ family response regulator/HPt (histidine-containing phosphotransfer) domain-containing protein